MKKKHKWPYEHQNNLENSALPHEQNLDRFDDLAPVGIETLEYHIVVVVSTPLTNILHPVILDVSDSLDNINLLFRCWNNLQNTPLDPSASSGV